MKVKVTQPLFEMNGNEIKEGDKVLELKEILIRASLAELDKEEKSKLEDFNLFIKIKTEGDEIEFTNLELIRLQEKVKKAFGILVYGQINAILEGKENPIKSIKNHVSDVK